MGQVEFLRAAVDETHRAGQRRVLCEKGIGKFSGQTQQAVFQADGQRFRLVALLDRKSVV